MTLRHALLLAALSLALPARAADAEAPDAAAVATLEQVTLPALSARQAGAEARAEAARGYFEGAAPLERAWPDLAGQPLGDAAVLDGLGAALRTRQAERAKERIALLPEALDDDHRARLAAERTAALDAEDAADALTARLLGGLTVGVAAAPGLADPQLAERLTALQAARTAATAGLDPTAEGWADAARRAADIAADEGRLRQLQVAAWRAMTVPGDDTLARLVRADIALVDLLLAAPDSRLPSADETEALARVVDRLQRTLPLLDAALATTARARVEQADRSALQDEAARLKQESATLEGQLQGDGDDAGDASVEELKSTAAAARRAQEQAAARVAALEAEGPGTESAELHALRLEVARLRRGRAELRAGLAGRRLARAERLAELGLEGTDVTEADVEAAREDAEAARAAAEAAESAAFAESTLAQQISDMTAERVRLIEARKARAEEAEGEIESLEETLGKVRTDRAEAEALPPLAREREAKLAAAYGAAADLVRQAQKAVATRAASAEDVVADDDATLAGFPQPGADLVEMAPAELVARWTAVNQELAAEAVERSLDARREIEAGLVVLDDAREVRRALRPSAGPDQRAKDADLFLPELTTEVGNVPVRAEVWWWRLRQGRGGLLDRLGSLVTRSIEGLLLLVIWAVARRRTDQWLAVALEASAQRSPSTNRVPTALAALVETGDVRLLQQPLVAALVIGLDVLAAWFGAGLFWEPLRPLSVALYVLLAVQLVRLGPRLVHLALGTPGDPRPCLRRVPVDTEALAARTVRLLLGWTVALRLVDWMAETILMTDRISDLVRTAGTIVLVGLVLWCLARWAPIIRRAIAAGEQNRLTSLLVRESNNSIVQVAQAVLGLVLLAERLVARLLGRIIEQRAGLAWVAAAVARQRLKEAQGAPANPLDPARVAEIRRALHTQPMHPEELEVLEAAHAAWREGDARGLVALTGERGTGKSRLLDALEARLPDDLEVVRLRPDEHVTDADAALAWLARSIGCVPDPWPDNTTERAEALIRELNEQPRQIVLIDDAHMLFLRAVGGFRALRRLLGVLHATADTHLWVCAFHAPAWGFLEGVAESVNLGVFRQRVPIAPLSPDALATWLEARTVETGLTLDYGELSGESILGAEPQRAAERARQAFWRLLAEEARGNPRVAGGYWLTALRAGPDAETAAVGLFETPQQTDVESLGARELFVLTALAIHDGLTIDNLVEVLNLPAGVCRAVARQLEARGMLSGDIRAEQYRIQPAWSPAVHRVLRTRQFLHGGA